MTWVYSALVLCLGLQTCMLQRPHRGRHSNQGRGNFWVTPGQGVHDRFDYTYSRYPAYKPEICPPGTDCSRNECGSGCEAGTEGPVGPPGPRGPGGVSGIQGENGKHGEEGEMGPPGWFGLDGLSGMKGNPGIEGAPGGRGHPGLPGKQGPSGMLGPVGVVGCPGERGLDGVNGACGKAGKLGPDGKRGSTGPPGKDGYPGEDGDKGKDGLPGCKGMMGCKGKPGTCECRRKDCGTCDCYPGSTIIARHSQSLLPAECPPAGTKLWEGYSLLYTENDGNSAHQDLGSASSCVEDFNPLPFMVCNTHGKCSYEVRTGKSFWLSIPLPTTSTVVHKDEAKQCVSRCVVCLIPSTAIAVHRQSEHPNLPPGPPPCPEGWDKLWSGYSFLMSTVGSSGGGQQLMSPGSCLEKFHRHPYIECGGHQNCYFYSNKLSFWLVSASRVSEATLKGDHEQRRMASRCSVCMLKCNSVPNSDLATPMPLPWRNYVQMTSN